MAMFPNYSDTFCVKKRMNLYQFGYIKSTLLGVLEGHLTFNSLTSSISRSIVNLKFL